MSGMLLNNSESVTRKAFGEIRSQAIKEIVNGVYFLHRKGMPIVSSTLSEHFDVASKCDCLLANATNLRFLEALTALRISQKKAEQLGCLNSEEPERLDRLDWKMLYNRLWKRTGRFFRKNPRFGVA
jgi:hypothetical protein